MPGGLADINLSVSENIIKESKEEAGVEVILKKIIVIQDRNRYTLSQLSEGRNTKEQIEMCFKAYENPSIETIFD